MGKMIVAALGAVSAVGLRAMPVQADYVSRFGDIEIAEEAPTSVEISAWESSTNVRVFQENASFTLTNRVRADFSRSGTTYDDRKDYTPVFLESETTVDSYLIHVDPVREQSFRYSGSITFEQEILGIIVSWKGLRDSSRTLGSEETSYRPRPGHGLEIGRDKITWSEDGKTLHISGHARPKMDQIRVLTKPFQGQSVVDPPPVPAAGTLPAMLLGAAAVGSRRRRHA